jgi:hypothetical protein
VMTLSAPEKGYIIREARWALARELRLARSVRRSMRVRARGLDDSDWRLANAYRSEAAARDHVIDALRAVSRTLRGR